MLRLGHTGITWGIPGDVARAYADVAELGYAGFETFGSTLVDYRGQEGDYAALAQRCGIPTVAAFCWSAWTDPETRASEIATVLREAQALHTIGGRTVVVGCGIRSRPDGYTDAEFRHVASALTEVAQGCADLGLQVGLHPHTGTGIETRGEIDRILEMTEPPLGFAPDSGQIAKGGSDVVDVFSTYLERITHVHLKDWNGVVGDDEESDKSGYLNYEAIGDGVVPIRDLLVMLDDVGFDGWVNVELDGTERSPRPPREAAARSKAYLQEQLGSRITWR